MENFQKRKTEILKILSYSCFSTVKKNDLVFDKTENHYTLEKGRIGLRSFMELKEHEILCYFENGKLVLHPFFSV